ncbi:HD-GYP domain-containing protein [Tepidibacillus marianensis]|uniref:HD-GYP domain-containing protein n=1 Tax=Tepidibacillus marianensis TaxID=3131995 RepID=UPI0030CF5D32
MRRKYTTDCQAGDSLAKPIYNDIGAVLINRGIKLTDALIQRLIQLEVDFVYIVDERVSDIQMEEVLSDNTRQVALKTIKTTFQDLFRDKLVHHPLTKGNLASSFRPIISDMLSDMQMNLNAMVMLSDIFVKDFYLYNHSLQVAIYSMAMGMAKDFTQQQICDLGLGALLHDIGKTKLSIELLNKERLTSEEFQLYEKHTQYGFNILRKEHGLSLLSAHCALQHHEQIDGRGYPRHLVDQDIHEYARIVSIADLYDRLTSNQPRSRQLLPHHALEYMNTRVGHEIDREWLGIFKQMIAPYPLGVALKLNTGEMGVVVDINSKYADRPVVRILEHENGETFEPYEIDLSKNQGKIIVGYSSF